MTRPDVTDNFEGDDDMENDPRAGKQMRRPPRWFVRYGERIGEAIDAGCDLVGDVLRWLLVATLAGLVAVNALPVEPHAAVTAIYVAALVAALASWVGWLPVLFADDAAEEVDTR